MTRKGNIANALQGIAGIFYFEKGWIGKPWDNFYVVENVITKGSAFTMKGVDWELSGMLRGITIEDSHIRMALDGMTFRLGSKCHDTRDLGRLALLYTGEEYFDLSTLI